MCRSAAISSPTPTALIRNIDDLEIGGFRPLEAAARAGAGQPGSDDPRARRPQGQAAEHGRPHRRCRGGSAYVDGDLNIGVSVSHHDFQIWRPDPLLARSRRSSRTADHRRAPDRARRSRQRTASAASSSMFEFRGGIAKYHHDELDARRASRLELLHATAARCAPISSRPSAAAGAARAASSISTRRPRSAATRNICPTASKRQLGLFTLQIAGRGPLRFEARRAGRIRASSTPMRTRRSRRTAAIVGDHADSRAVHAGFRLRSARTTNSSPAWRVGLSLSHSERAPSIEELFAQRAARRQRAFLIGDPDLKHGNEQFGRAQPPPHDRPGARPGQRLLQPLLQLHLIRPRPATSGTACRSSLSPGQGRIITVSSSSSDAKFGKALGDRLGRRARSPTPCARRSGISAPRRRSRRSGCSRGTHRHARPGRRPARGRAASRAQTAPRRTRPDARLHAWSMRRSTGTRSRPTRS